MSSRHGSTKYRDSSANIKVLLRHQTNMTLNDRFHKIMKLPAPQPLRDSTPPRERRLREELRNHQRKLESLERSTMHMMSRSLAQPLPTIRTPTLPTAPIYEPPKPSAKSRLAAPQISAKARLGRVAGGSAKQRLGAKRLTQKYAKQRTAAAVTTVKRLSTGPSSATRGSTTRGRGGSSRGRGGRGGRGGAAGTREKKTVNADDLDKELDSYMSNSKSYLDNQLDSYMAQKGEKEASKS